jgi:hypothetical protein
MTFTNLEFDFHLSRKIILFIVKEMCKAIWKVLLPKKIPLPNKEIRLTLAQQVHLNIDLPNSLSAVHGKHIRILHPPSSGLQYLNSKKYLSVTLLGAPDANYSFTATDVSAYGHNGDSNTFKTSNLE